MLPSHQGAASSPGERAASQQGMGGGGEGLGAHRWDCLRFHEGVTSSSVEHVALRYRSLLPSRSRRTRYDTYGLYLTAVGTGLPAARAALTSCLYTLEMNCSLWRTSVLPAV